MTTRLLPLGDSAWTIEFGTRINTELNGQVMALANRVAQARIDNPLFAAVTDVVPTFRSLTVHFAPQATDADALAAQLLAFAHNTQQSVITGKHWRLPACFDPSFALDLPAWAQAKQMREDQLIERVLATQFRVYMIGFLPGFPYMGGLPLNWPCRVWRVRVNVCRPTRWPLPAKCVRSTLGRAQAVGT